MKTKLGASISILIGVLTAVFALIKLEHLLNRKNPSLTSYSEAIGADEFYDTQNEDFMMAFTLENWISGAKDDPRYI